MRGLSTPRSEEHTSELQLPDHLVCRLLLEKKKKRPSSGDSICATMRPSASAISAQRTSNPVFLSFFFNDTATTEIYTLSLHERSSDLIRCLYPDKPTPASAPTPAYDCSRRSRR